MPHVAPCHSGCCSSRTLRSKQAQASRKNRSDNGRTNVVGEVLRTVKSNRNARVNSTPEKTPRKRKWGIRCSVFFHATIARDPRISRSGTRGETFRTESAHITLFIYLQASIVLLAPGNVAMSVSKVRRVMYGREKGWDGVKESSTRTRGCNDRRVCY